MIISLDEVGTPGEWRPRFFLIAFKKPSALSIRSVAKVMNLREQRTARKPLVRPVSRMPEKNRQVRLRRRQMKNKRTFLLTCWLIALVVTGGSSVFNASASTFASAGQG